MKESLFPLKKSKHLYVVQEVLNPHQPTIIFLHDSLGCVQLWRDFPKQLCEALNCNLLVYDRLGYGKSSVTPSVRDRDHFYMHHQADILLDMIAYYDINTPLLFGHSDGGTIALLAAAKYPDIIKGIAVEGAHVKVEQITLDGVRDAKNAFSSTDISKRLAKYHGARVEHIYRAWIDIWLSSDFKNWNIVEELQSIICPTLVIQGSEDEFGSLDQVESILSVVSSSHKLIIDGEGHSPHKNSSNQIIAACKKLFI